MFKKLVDKTAGVARLHKPGSLFYALRPPGWGKTFQLQGLAHLLRGGAAARDAFAGDTWIRQHRSLLFRQPAMRPVVISLSRAALRQEPLHAQFLRQLAPPGSADADADAKASKLSDMLSAACTPDDVTRCVETAAKMHAGGPRFALLVDDFDDPFFDNTFAGAADDVAVFLEGCSRSVLQKRGAGLLFMAGTFRPAELTHVLSGMGDLSLDLQHNNTWGLVAADVVAGYASVPPLRVATDTAVRSKRYRWDAASMQPVLEDLADETADMEDVEVHGTAALDDHRGTRAPFSRSGGYWFGGYEESDGTPEAVFPLVPWGPGSIAQERCQQLLLREGDAVRSGREVCNNLRDLTSALYDMTPAERFNSAVAKDKTRSGGCCDHWPVVLLQAGVLTLGARALRFDEFHSYAWLRLGFPNEEARRFFTEKIMRMLYIRAVGSGFGDGSVSVSWAELQTALSDLSSGLVGHGGGSSVSGSVRAPADIASALRTIKVASKLFGEGLLGPSGGDSATASADLFKLLVLCAPHIDVHRRNPDDVSDTGLGQDTFSGSKGRDIMARLAPRRTGFELVGRVRDGRAALPRYGGEFGWEDPPEGTLLFVDGRSGTCCAVVEIEGRGDNTAKT